MNVIKVIRRANLREHVEKTDHQCNSSTATFAVATCDDLARGTGKTSAVAARMHDATGIRQIQHLFVVVGLRG